jgi:adsorption protein B
MYAIAMFADTFTLVDLVSMVVFATQIFLALFGAIFFLSGLDDLFVDCCYVAWRCYRRLGKREGGSQFDEEALRRNREQPIAILVPAWDESDVIRPMLANTLRTIQYDNYHIFIGTYPNDYDTQTEVDKIAADFPNVHRVVCANPGPTCKADCLNWIYQGIRLFEKSNGVRFEIFLMEDCEDLVHPLCLKVFNHMIPGYDMVQIPVFPLQRKWTDLIGGHYLDEFTEYHGKDIFVRRILSGAIPAAGVGCGFSRRAVTAMAERNEYELFNTGSLTEDYEFGLTIGLLGLRSTFISPLLPFNPHNSGVWRPRDGADRRVAVREYFPSTLRTAVKQKSRWVIGIALQGWKNLGWQGNPGMRYMLYRDRKAILTNEVCLFGYVIVLIVMTLLTYTRLASDAYSYPALVEKGSWLWNLLLVNLGFLLNRLGWRFYSVNRIYGWKQGLLAVPRQVCSNIVNGFATSRAIYMFVLAGLLRKRIAWDKTAHVLPAQLALATDSAASELK